MDILNSQKCPNCNTTVSRQAKFCPSCGARLAGGTRTCGACGTENRGDARFCKQCGQPLDRSETAPIYRHRWARGEGDFAVRIEAEDLPGLLKSGLKVEPGTNAMLIESGANRGLVPPGEYTLGTFGQRLKDWVSGNIPERVTVLLLDVTPADLEFHLGGRFTSDPLPIGMSVRTQVKVEEPGKFLFNVLKGRERYTLEDLRQYLYPEVVQLADRWLRQHTLSELVEDPAQRAKFELALEEALRTTLGQTGLQFLQVRTVELNLEPYEEITGMRAKTRLMDQRLAAETLLAEAELHAAEQKARQEGETGLRLDELRASYEQRKARLDLETRQNYAELQKEIDLLDLAEETRKVEKEEQRIDLYQRMRQAVLSDKMNEVRSEAEFVQFMEEVGFDKKSFEKERNELLRTWREEAEDHEGARAHLLAKLEVERNYELRSVELKLRSDLTEQQLDAELHIERRRTEEQEAIEYARAESRLRRQKMEDDYAREKIKLNAIAERESELERAINQARIRGEERETDRLDAELGILLLEKMKAVRRTDEFERDLHALEVKEKELEMELRRKEHEMELRIREMREQHNQAMEAKQKDQDFELSRIDRIRAFGQAGAVILANPEQARVIQALSETESMAGMSPEAIMARVSERSPDAAKAFAEMMRNQDGEARAEMAKFYERLYDQLQNQLRQQEAFIREQRDSQREQAHLQQNMYEKGMDTASQIARDVAQASHRDQSNPPVIIVPSSNSPQTIYPGGGPTQPQDAPTKTCPQCSKPVSLNAKFCEHCRYEFPG